MERPNTIAGLQAKRSELLKLHEQLVEDAKKVMCDLDHIDATIRLFDPEADLQRRARNRYAVKHRAQFGHTKRFILDLMRRADAPMTSRQITEAWAKDRGLKADEATLTILRKRIGACLTACRKQELVEFVGMSDDGDPFGPYKLWKIKQSL
jgi:hypothetical protein